MRKTNRPKPQAVAPVKRVPIKRDPERDVFFDELFEKMKDRPGVSK